ncbi:ROK family protein [Cutibacterium sp. V970]|uniref:ROK family protein n=1 Tax=Cutibacterium sp. V970 TaxID=3446481 RepID=UPI003F5049F1
MFGARSVIPCKVLDDLLRQGPCTRAQLSRMIGVPNGSITKAVNVLLDCGLVTAGEMTTSAARSGMGRPGEIINPNSSHVSLLGMKILPTSIVGCRTNLAGDVEQSETIETGGTTRDQILTGLVHAALRLSKESTVIGIGVSIGGIVGTDHATLLVNDLVEAEPGRILDGLAERVGAPVYLENDVRCLVAMEQRVGLGRRASSFNVITVGMGVAVCVVDQGVQVRGTGGKAGLQQHLMTYSHTHERLVPASQVLTTDPILARAGELGLPTDVDQLTALAETDADAVAELGRYMAVGLAPIVANLQAFTDPQALLVGGELGPIVETGIQDLEREVRRITGGCVHLPPVHFADWHFGDWARAAAMTALTLILAPEPSS